MNQNEIINEEPMTTPSPFYCANSHALDLVRNEYIRLYGLTAGTERLQALTKNQVETEASEIKAHVNAAISKSTRNSCSTHNNYHDSEEPLDLPKYKF